MAANVTSVDVMLTWQPPSTPNGIINGYLAWYTETLVCNNSQVSNSTRVSLPAAANMYTFTGLEEDTPYVFYVSAETAAGEGEAATVMNTTLEDGEYLYVLFNIYIVPFSSCWVMLVWYTDTLDLQLISSVQSYICT